MVHEKFNRYNFQIQLAAFSALALVIASFILTAMHPAAGEILSSLLIKIGLLINLALAGMSLLVLVGFAAWGFGKGIKIRLVPVDNAPARLPAVSHSTDKDEFIILWPGGDEADFLAKGLAAKEGRKTASAWKWSVLIAYRSPHITICGDEVMTYCRDEAIFARPEWPNFSGCIAEPGTAFTTETPEQFEAFVRKFVQIFREWSQRVKAEQTAGKVGVPMLEIIKHSANIALFILLSISAVFAQSKTRQVDEILGTRIRETPTPGADVSFMFDEGTAANPKIKTYNRIGDGKSGYTALLQKSPGIGKFNDEGGVLIAITKDGEVIARAARAERVNATPSTKAEQMRPVPADDAPPVAVMDKPAFAVPDSLEMAYMAENVRVEFDKAGRQAVSAARPWFDTLNYIFMWIYPLLLLVGGVSYLWAFVAAKQGMYDTHRVSMQAFTWVALITATVVLINALVFAFSFDLHPALLTLIAAIEVGIVVYIVHKVSPDFRPSFGNEPEGQSIFTPVKGQRRIG